MFERTVYIWVSVQKTKKYPFSRYRDMEVAELCVKNLKRKPESEDALYALYFILSYMPLNNVKALFKANKLTEFFEKLEENYKKNRDEERVILVQKITDFQVSNHLSEELQRLAIRCEESKFDDSR